MRRRFANSTLIHPLPSRPSSHHSFLHTMSSRYGNSEQEKGDNGSGVTAESYGAVDVCTDAVWLLKIPQALAQAIDSAPQGTVLGDLVFTKGGTDSHGKTIKPTFTVHIAEELSQAPAAAKSSTSTALNLPLHYSLQSMTKKVPVLHPVVRHPLNGSMELWGTVSRTANVQVQQDARYRALVKDRLVATNITASRFVKPMENTESVMSRTSAHVAGLTSTKNTFGDAVLQFGKRRIEALEQNSQATSAVQGQAKRARQFSPDQPLRSVVFELFQQQKFWAVKDLKAAAVAGGATSAASRKGESELREVLREIGEYHRLGDHKNKWELRKEYQQG